MSKVRVAIAVFTLVLLASGIAVGARTETAHASHGYPLVFSCGSVFAPKSLPSAFTGTHALLSYRALPLHFTIPDCADVRHTSQLTSISLLTLGIMCGIGFLVVTLRGRRRPPTFAAPLPAA